MASAFRRKDFRRKPEATGSLVPHPLAPSPAIRQLRYYERMLRMTSVQMCAGLALVSFGMAASAQGQTPQPPPPAPPQYSAVLNVGDRAPEFKLPGSDGKVHSLSSYKGKTVVLAWFPKAFTGG